MLDPADGTARRRELIVRDGVITETRAAGDPRSATADPPPFDATGMLIVPGLINAHTHGHANVMKGVADRWPLEVSLTYGPSFAGPRDAEAVYCSTLLGAVEMLEKGITACYDLVYAFPRVSAEGLQAAAQAYADAGMRAVLAPMVADRTLFDAYPDLAASLPPALAQRARAFAPLDDTLAALGEVLSSLRLPLGISLGIAPTIPLHCSDAFLAACRAMAERAGVPVHMHLAESRLQATAGARAYGRSLTAHIAAAGLLGPRFTAAHGIWLDADDLDILAAAGVCVAHVPASNFRLGSGIASVRPMLERGIDVALATDGCNCSDSLDMFLAMRLAAFASRAYAAHRDGWLSSLDVVRAATLGGAAAIGMRGRLGRPAPGFDADLTFLDLADTAFIPLNDPLNQIVNCDASHSVRVVMVAGRFAVRDGRADAWTPEARERVAASHARLRADATPARALAADLEPFVAQYVADHLDDPAGVERYVRPSHRTRSLA